MFWPAPNLLQRAAPRRWPLALLFAGLLLSGQLLAFDHLHLDESPDSPCWVCVHGDAAPLVGKLDPLPPQANVGGQPLAERLPLRLAAPLRGPQHSRAPPFLT